MIDEFLRQRPADQNLTLIYTTRSNRKGAETLDRLHDHISKSPRGDRTKNNPRITLQPENVDLTQLVTVRKLAETLKLSVPKLDAIILNAGLGGFTGINWPLAVWCNLTDIVTATTWPIYKLSSVGSTTGLQSNGSGAKEASTPEPPLGEVFCANVFGHYLLSHLLLPILSTGKIIWVSSIEPDSKVFNPDDIQGLKSPKAYEHSKRLTDLLALGANLPSAKSSVSQFLTPPSSESSSSRPQMYLAHPGICGTSIIQLPYLLTLSMEASFYATRWLGSPWHNITPYLGAAAPVFLALSTKDEIDRVASLQAPCRTEDAHLGVSTTAAPVDGSLVKWGSGVTRSGESLILKTEVEGWGYTGVVGEEIAPLGRKKGAANATKETLETFEEQAMRAWREIEELRNSWEERLFG